MLKIAHFLTLSLILALLGGLLYVHFYWPGDVQIQGLGWVLSFSHTVMLGLGMGVVAVLFGLGSLWQWLAIVPVRWQHSREQKRYKTILKVLSDCLESLATQEKNTTLKTVQSLKRYQSETSLFSWLQACVGSAKKQALYDEKADDQALWIALKDAENQKEWQIAQKIIQKLLDKKVYQDNQALLSRGLEAALYTHSWSLAYDFLDQIKKHPQKEYLHTFLHLHTHTLEDVFVEADAWTLPVFKKALALQEKGKKEEAMRLLLKHFQAFPSIDIFKVWMPLFVENMLLQKKKSPMILKNLKTNLKSVRNNTDFSVYAFWAEAMVAFELKAWDAVKEALEKGLEQGLYKELLQLKAAMLFHQDKQAEKAYNLLEQALQAPSLPKNLAEKEKAYACFCHQYQVAPIEGA